MNRLLSILFLFCIYSHLYAQTPYDSFSPATSRPILDVVQNLDAYNDSLQPSPMDASLATQDDVSKWLSPDPLSDKYPEISPYAYCGWNPVKYIDPDGREVWELDINAGDFQKVGNKGGSITDYYTVGTYEKGVFNSYSDFEIKRGDGVINSFRIEETNKSTISAFHIPETNTAGFFLERPGPDTAEPGKALRIPFGQYGLYENNGTRYPCVPRLYLLNEGIDGNFANRGILIHVGNFPENSMGCLLPGNSRATDFVGNSRNTLSEITSYIVSKKWMVRLNIFNVFK